MLRRLAVATPDAPALTHLDDVGRARMVAVEAKPETHRVAIAQAAVALSDAGFAAVIAGSKKGDALQVARIAGIQAAKRTSDLIPLCHPLRLTHVAVTADPDAERRIVVLRATVEAVDRTGVEMEALTAVTVAALALYDMVKAVDHAAVIERVHLVEKRGGKRGLVRPHG
jgi:cyclic pyranopterin phosphate synthase